MKKTKLLLLMIVVLIAATAIGLKVWQGRKNKTNGDAVTLYGNIDIRQVQLAFNDSERIAALLAQEGDHVQAKQLLGKLDTQRYDANVSNREAKVAAQRQIVARMEAGNRPEEIQKANADLAATKADLQNAQLNFDRIEPLVKQGVETPQRMDQVRSALDGAKARVEAAQKAYDLMVLGPRKEDIASAKATLQANEADLVLARRELADANLYAPTNGVVQARLLEVGDMASPQKPVFTLALDDPVWVRAYLPETDLGKVRLGMKADVTTDSFPGKRYEGWIGFISPAAEFTPKSVETPEVRTKLVYQVRIFVNNPQGELRLGMPAVVSVSLNQSAPSPAANTNTP
jgi:HlyD family secretion protein